MFKSSTETLDWRTSTTGHIDSARARRWAIGSWIFKYFGRLRSVTRCRARRINILAPYGLFSRESSSIIAFLVPTFLIFKAIHFYRCEGSRWIFRLVNVTTTQARTEACAWSVKDLNRTELISWINLSSAKPINYGWTTLELSRCWQLPFNSEDASFPFVFLETTTSSIQQDIIYTVMMESWKDSSNSLTCDLTVRDENTIRHFRDKNVYRYINLFVHIHIHIYTYINIYISNDRTFIKTLQERPNHRRTPNYKKKIAAIVRHLRTNHGLQKAVSNNLEPPALSRRSRHVKPLVLQHAVPKRLRLFLFHHTRGWNCKFLTAI
jgi:hypothetical protein